LQPDPIVANIMRLMSHLPERTKNKNIAGAEQYKVSIEEWEQMNANARKSPFGGDIAVASPLLATEI